MTKDKDSDDKVVSIHSVKPPVDLHDHDEDCDQECADCPERDECPDAQQYGCGDPRCPECQSRRVQQIQEITECLKAVLDLADATSATNLKVNNAMTLVSARLAKSAQWISTQVYCGEEER